MKRVTLIIVFVLFTSLALLERLTPFYINNAFLHYTVLFLAITSFTLIAGHFLKREGRNFTIATVSLVALICYGKYIMSWRGVWKTQTVLFENIDNPKTTIDYQLRADKLTLGYRNRIIKRQRIAPFADWTTDEDTDTLRLDPTIWRKVDKEINEMGLKDQ